MKDENRVEGLVTEVIYANDHNGYKVCEVEQEDGDSVTIVGIITAGGVDAFTEAFKEGYEQGSKLGTK